MGLFKKLTCKSNVFCQNSNPQLDFIRVSIKKLIITCLIDYDHFDYHLGSTIFGKVSCIESGTPTYTAYGPSRPLLGDSNYGILITTDRNRSIVRSTVNIHSMQMLGGPRGMP